MYEITPLELLYHADPVYACPLWLELVDNRQLFVSEVMLRQYLGFVRVCVLICAIFEALGPPCSHQVW